MLIREFRMKSIRSMIYVAAVVAITCSPAVRPVMAGSKLKCQGDCRELTPGRLGLELDGVLDTYARNLDEAVTQYNNGLIALRNAPDQLTFSNGFVNLTAQTYARIAQGLRQALQQVEPGVLNPQQSGPEFLMVDNSAIMRFLRRIEALNSCVNSQLSDTVEDDFNGFTIQRQPVSVTLTSLFGLPHAPFQQLKSPPDAKPVIIWNFAQIRGTLDVFLGGGKRPWVRQ